VQSTATFFSADHLIDGTGGLFFQYSHQRPLLSLAKGGQEIARPGQTTYFEWIV